MRFIIAENVSKTRAARAKRWLWNRGILSKWEAETKTFTVLVTKHGAESCERAMNSALKREERPQ